MPQDDIRDGDLIRIEYLLKKDMARRMGVIQEDRAAGPGGSRNVGNAREYVMHARTLRRVLGEKGGQGYVPLLDISNGTEWLDDDVADAADVHGTDDLLTVCEKVHGVRNPHFEPGSMTDHRNVPGTPSA